MKSITGSFDQVHEWLTLELSKAPVVNVGEWQAIRSGLPQEETIEVEDVSFEISISSDVELLTAATHPNLPWAEDHFQERVSGIPYNPPPSHEWWPFAQKNNDQHRKDQVFSHTYPERFWPTHAGDGTGTERQAGYAMRGLRFDYGDLDDLVTILKRNAGTRQAYLPVWFPEDLFAATLSERVPCTLGYHFLVRNGRLKIVYYIRSCDFYRHFNDDVYMAGRLAQWVAEQIGTAPSRLVMHLSSLHIFAAEKEMIDQQAKNILTKNMFKVW